MKSEDMNMLLLAAIGIGGLLLLGSKGSGGRGCGCGCGGNRQLPPVAPTAANGDGTIGSLDRVSRPTYQCWVDNNGFRCGYVNNPPSWPGGNGPINTYPGTIW